MYTCIIKEYFSYKISFDNPNIHMVIFENEVPKKT